MIQWNVLLITFLALFIVSMLVRLGLRFLNRQHLTRYGHVVPDVFKGEIEPDTLKRIRDYTVAVSNLGSIEILVDDLADLVIILSGFLPYLAGTHLLSGLNPVLAGIVFMFACSFLLGVIEVPFDLYGTFVIERRFGFSTITFKLWLKDQIKTLLLSGLIMGIILAVFLELLYSLPRLWWLPAWVCFVLFQLLLTWLYPKVIAPLFNKFETIEDETLKKSIGELLERAGFHLTGLFKMDASTRSRHTNAYFTGIGKFKRIVLFDTLINTHTPEEITAVLAHELGHLKKGHVRKQLAASVVLSLAVLYVVAKLLAWPALYMTFGFQTIIPFAGLFLITIIGKPFTFFFIPIGSMISRRYERQADAYARELTGSTVPLARALKRLAKDNLANLHPHPLYAWFYYSHPPLAQRIEALERS
ncbi:MAG: M48 family metallopeptidase [Desulfomonilia bacterium]|jgi:STE24 endopeptidase